MRQTRTVYIENESIGDNGVWAVGDPDEGALRLLEIPDSHHYLTSIFGNPTEYRLNNFGSGSFFWAEITIERIPLTVPDTMRPESLQSVENIEEERLLPSQYFPAEFYPCDTSDQRDSRNYRCGGRAATVKNQGREPEGAAYYVEEVDNL